MTVSAYDVITAAPEDGQPGRSDLIIRRSIWKSNMVYCAGKEEDEFLDLVKYTSHWYRCTKTHISPATFSANSGWIALSWFENIATDFLLAENAVIRFLRGNQLTVEGSSGVIEAGMSGLSNVRIWAGGDRATCANFQVMNTGELSIAGGKIRLSPDGSGRLANGNITWDADGNPTVRGTYKTNFNGSRIEIDPVNNGISMYNAQGKVIATWTFTGAGNTYGFPRIEMRDYNSSGVLLRSSWFDAASIAIQNFKESSGTGYTHTMEIDTINGIQFFRGNVRTKHYPAT